MLVARATWRCLGARRCSSRRFSPQHEWVQPAAGGAARVGVSRFAAEALGDVVFAQLPAAGTRLAAGQECGALESVKAASELYAPVSGRVTEPNASVEQTPSLINTSCYEDGWLFKIDLADPKELDGLMTESQYQEFLKKDSDH